MSTIITCEIGEALVLLDLESEIEVDGPRNYELWRANTFSTKEPDTLAWIDSFFRPGDVIYDVGANIGQYALYAAKRFSKELKILAFEPEALNYAKLNKNIVLNDMVGTITPYCLALSGQM